MKPPTRRVFSRCPACRVAVFRQNQYGGTLERSASHVATYFFASYEGLRSLSASSTQHLVPNAAVRGGDFSPAGQIIFDPLTLNASGTVQPFPNNVIPASLHRSDRAKYLALYEPLPNYPLANGFDYVDSTPNRDNSDNGSVRIDHAWGERSRLFARYTINDERRCWPDRSPRCPRRRICARSRLPWDIHSRARRG